jgi:hypothetical protein
MAYTATNRCAYAADADLGKYPNAAIHEAQGGVPICGQGTRFATWKGEPGQWFPLQGAGDVTCGSCAIVQGEARTVAADGRPRAQRFAAPEARLTFFQKELARNRGAL